MDSKSSRFRLILLACLFILVGILFWKFIRTPTYGPPPSVTVTSSGLDLSDEADPDIDETHLATADLHWPGFLGRGRNQDEPSLGPLTWSANENIRWEVSLGGPGGSSPIVVGDKIFVSCYSGYGLDQKNPGKIENLRRHLVCVNRNDGSTLWEKIIGPPHADEDEFAGYVALHGYASNTPVSDGRYVYALFGKSGVFAFDMDGNEIWQTGIGSASNQDKTGSAASVVVHRGRLIVNACDESHSILALNTKDGSEIWCATIDGLEGAFGAPAIVQSAAGKTEVVLSIPKSVVGLDFETGILNWYFKTKQGESLVPTPIVKDEIVYALGGFGGTNFNAIRAGGRGDVTESNCVWTTRYASYVPSPALHNGNLFWVNEKGFGHVVSAETGELIQRKRLKGKFYASVVQKGNHIYAVSRDNGTYVLTATPDFKLVAHNEINSDTSEFLGSPAFAQSDMFIRSNSTLYCISQLPEKLVKAPPNNSPGDRR